MKLREAEQLPKAPAERGQGPHAYPQPHFRSGGGGGWSQAGFHTVNYSVANSAPGRGGRRESESEASHSGAQSRGAKAGRTRLSQGHGAEGLGHYLQISKGCRH